MNDLRNDISARFDMQEKVEKYIKASFKLDETDRFVPLALIAEQVSAAIGYPVERFLKLRIGKALAALGAKAGVKRIDSKLYRGYYLESL